MVNYLVENEEIMPEILTKRKEINSVLKIDIK